MNTQHTDQTLLQWTNDFIIFFGGIPEEKWCSGQFLNAEKQSCANGHCGVGINGKWETEKSIRLHDVFQVLPFADEYDANRSTYSSTAAFINNGLVKIYLHQTPKQRILAALHDVKNILESRMPRKDVTKELAILPVEETSDIIIGKKELV